MITKVKVKYLRTHGDFKVGQETTVSRRRFVYLKNLNIVAAVVPAKTTKA